LSIGGKYFFVWIKRLEWLQDSIVVGLCWSTSHHIFLAVGNSSSFIQLFGFFVSFNGGLHFFISFAEFRHYLFFCWFVALHPWVLEHLFDAGSVVGIESEHLGHEILEFLREELHAIGLAFAVGLPEYVSSIGGQASVERIAWLGGGEWWMLGNHNEQHYGSGEQVHLLALIWLLEVNFWCHIVHSS